MSVKTHLSLLLSFSFVAACASSQIVAPTETGPDSKGPVDLGPLAEEVKQVLTIDAKGKFLLSSSDDIPSNPLIVDLQGMQLFPGDTISIKVLGGYQFRVGQPTELSTNTVAVFSESDVILEKSELHRVPGAIDCGEDIETAVTWFEKLITDIPEDFDAREAEVVIPQKAKFLIVGVGDGYVTDNAAADGSYRVEITKK